MQIRQDDPANHAVADLLAQHVAFGRAHSPPENAHVLPAEGLRSPAITFWTAWDDATLLGFVALKEIGAARGELKSMRTAPAALRKGVGRALLAHVIETARRRGYTCLSLETGTSPPFDPANRLYETAGFIDGPVFGGYPPSRHNRFMHLEL